MSEIKTANVNVRIQENIKKQAEEILKTIGISRATAIDIFYRQIILNKGIPFSLTIPKSLPIKEMDEQEFNTMIGKGYLQAITGQTHDIEEVFREFEEEN